MGKKSAEKLLAGVEASKGRGLARLLSSLSIRHVGQRSGKLLAEHFGSIDALLAANEEQLQINEIGPAIAASVHEFLHSEYGQATMADLKQLGLRLEEEIKTPAAAASGILSGKTLVVTGTLAKYKRNEIEELIEQHGGRASGSVSAKTDTSSLALMRGANSRRRRSSASKCSPKTSSSRCWESTDLAGCNGCGRVGSRIFQSGRTLRFTRSLRRVR